MGDLNTVPISPTERQYLEDLEKAKRLSLDEYEREKGRWVKPPYNINNNNNSQHKPSQTDPSNNGDRRLSITGRPRPFSRAVSTSSSSFGLTATSSAGVIIQAPPVSINPPPESGLRRNRSLPYRVRNNSTPVQLNRNEVPAAAATDTTLQGEKPHAVTGNPSPLSPTNNKPCPSDDLIVFSSPKVTPKFAHFDLRSTSLLDTSSTSSSSSSSNGALVPITSCVRHSINENTLPDLFHRHRLGLDFRNIFSNTPSSYLNMPRSPIMEPFGMKNGNLISRITSPTGTAGASTPSLSPTIPHSASFIGANANSRAVSPVILRSPTTASSASSSSARKSTTAYSLLSEQLKSMSMSDDLIDLGQTDGRNILEYFDPLVIKEKGAEDGKTVVKPPDGDEEVKRRQQQTQEQQQKGRAHREDSVISVQSSASMASTAASFNYFSGPSMSLYPSLQEFQSEVGIEKDKDSEDASSFYDVYNPFEYILTVSSNSSSTYEPTFFSSSTNNHGGQRSIGFSHYIQKDTSTPSGPPALPPRNSGSPQPNETISSKVPLNTLLSSSEQEMHRVSLYENIESVKQSTTTDSEIQAFFEMIRELRFSNRHVDSTTNVGYVRSSTLDTKCLESLSVKVNVWNHGNMLTDPAAFTCDVSATVDMVIDQSLSNLELEGSSRDYTLRVKGLNEYLSANISIAKYRYVQECIKLDQDIMLVLVHKSVIEQNNWARTPRDDANCVSITVDDILPETHSKTITHQEISIPLEFIDRELGRIREKLTLYPSNKDVTNLQLNPSSLIQPVKAVCVLLGEVQTVEITDSLDSFVKTCNEWNSKVKEILGSENKRRTKIVSDCSSRLSFVEILPRTPAIDEDVKKSVLEAIYRLEDGVRKLVEMYSKSFPVSFRMKSETDTQRSGWSGSCKPMAEMIESFYIRIGAVHRLKPEWLNTYTDFYLLADAYYGIRLMGRGLTPMQTITKSDGNVFFNTLVFNKWISIEHLPVCILPRESRIVFTLYGRKPLDDGTGEVQSVDLGWTSIQCFNFNGMLAQGNYLLPFWPVGLVQKRLGPAPDSTFSSDGQSPLLTVEFTDYGVELPFPEVPTAVLSKRDFSSLDPDTQSLLKDIVGNSTFTRFPAEEREVLWEKRHYLYEFPHALPQVLLAAQLWDYASLAELHAMLQCWEPLEPIDALQLLQPCFPDTKVREQAIEWISKMHDEELINLLPQLVEAMSFETFDYSPLARFLLKKSLSCLKIAHYLFWLLVSQVGLGRWTAEFSTDDHHIVSKIPAHDAENVYDPKRRRLELMLNSLLVISGAKWKEALISQYRLMEGFYNVASQVKAASNSSRQNVLMQELAKVQMHVLSSNKSIPLPLSPSYDVTSLDIKSSSYFTSASVPLKIVFNVGLPERGQISTLYKVGDDLRQDMLTIQIVRVVEKWWLESGLDLRVLTFSCIPTGVKQGFVEMVPNAETLCRIQAEHGLTGAFRNRPISEWLAKMNPSTLDYRRAVENFTLSCAAYCVVTYVLGICDRHNDNIMLTKKGHLFHIDFGKFLGDAQMFGNIIKRDRSPFVLTSDMVYVITDGEKDSSKFHRFVELCCQAFRVVRQNGNTLLNLFALMATAGVPGVDQNSVKYVQNALLLDCSNAEAAARFASFIQESLQNWFTSFNFFIHTMAQWPFQENSIEDNTKLSFVPTIFTMEMDGRIEHVKLLHYIKKYDPEKFYVYTIEVKRKGQTECTTLHRSYKEFLEFHTKLCLNFPMAVGTLKSLPRGSALSRSNVKQVTEKRKLLLQMFLESLFSLADEISHSNLVYTFFHPLLRDEEQHQEDELERRNSSRVSLTRNPARIHGQIKLSLEYTRGALHVLILHAVDLACPNGTPPSPYVKTYLQPDPYRKTKRKTKVVKKSQHPTFMEMIEYRLPFELIRTRVLAVSVWHHDPFQENNFLGGKAIQLASLNLSKETTETYTLGNMPSMS